MQRFVLIFAFLFAVPVSAQTVLYQNNLETCNFSGITFVAGHRIVQSPAIGQCAAASVIAGSSDPLAKLVKSITPSNEVWVNFWTNWDGVQLPGQNRGPHIVRIMTQDYGTGNVHLDFNIQAGTSQIQLHVDGRGFVRNTGWNPTSVRGWQYWQVGCLLNDVGQSNGFCRSFRGVSATPGVPPAASSMTLIGELTNLDIRRGNSSMAFRFVDLMSNIGGWPGTWSSTNGSWIGDNYVVATGRINSGISPSPPVTVTIAPTSATLQVGEKQLFQTTITNASQFRTFSLTGGMGTISQATGEFTATTAGTGTVRACAQDAPAVCATANVTVTAAPPPPTPTDTFEFSHVVPAQTITVPAEVITIPARTVALGDITVTIAATNISIPARSVTVPAITLTFVCNRSGGTCVLK